MYVPVSLSQAARLELFGCIAVRFVAGTTDAMPSSL